MPGGSFAFTIFYYDKCLIEVAIYDKLGLEYAFAIGMVM